MARIWPAIFLLLISGCASLIERDRQAQEQRHYHLPWTSGESHRCIQSGPGSFSHEIRDEFAVDFAMPEGTPLLAARGGVVAAVREDSDRSGSTRDFAGDANFVHIAHEDGTRSVYLHLRQNGAAVESGGPVRQGDVIGFSGSTGWSTTPHLHFAVERRDLGTGNWRSIPFGFIEVTGSGVPRILGRYRSRNLPAGKSTTEAQRTQRTQRRPD
jgi:murein DD-endopeptidase MepM/ murein hydrolase activator NlpD